MHRKSSKERYFLPHLCFTLCTAFCCMLFFSIAYASEKNVITLNTAKKTMTVSDTFQLTADISDNRIKSSAILWKSSRPKTASVSRSGLVKAKKSGTAKITATVKGTGCQAVCIIKVKKSPKTSLHYSNAGIEFDYPHSLKCKKNSSEDGSRYEFEDENGIVFWYEQGEKWRADLEQSQPACQTRLDEKFTHVSIDEFTDKNINGIIMRKVIFHLTDSNQKVTEYLMVSKYAFYDFYFMESADDFADSLIKSIQLEISEA